MIRTTNSTRYAVVAERKKETKSSYHPANGPMMLEAMIAPKASNSLASITPAAMLPAPASALYATLVWRAEVRPRTAVPRTEKVIALASPPPV